MSLKNVGTTFRAAVAILAISLVTLVSDATAQQVFCGTTWTTACASVTVEVVEVVANGQFSDKTAVGNYVLVISMMNVSLNDPMDLTIDTEASVIREVLFDIPASNLGTLQNWWVTDGIVDWDVWNIEDGEFIKIGMPWTQDVRNGDGSCFGIVTVVTKPDLPCGGDDPDHRTLAVFHLAFDRVPALENWAAQLVSIDAPTCYPPDMDPAGPYCESDWAVVPEPVTMTLVGTGLVGLGLMRRRRRRGLDIVED